MTSDRYNEDGSNKREGDQVKPIPNDQPSCQGDFIARVHREMPERMQMGLERYGTLLQPFNGRDFMRDAFDELNDLSVYLEGVAREREAMMDLLFDLASWPRKPSQAITEMGTLTSRAQVLLASMGQAVEMSTHKLEILEGQA